VPVITGNNSDRAAADWSQSQAAVDRIAAERSQRRTDPNNVPVLNRITLDIIRDGTTLGTPQNAGNRHRLLYSAARNLGEFVRHFPQLVHALLTEAGLDSGLPPKDVARQINCGLSDAERGSK
jgi:hypothetical protein